MKDLISIDDLLNHLEEAKIPNDLRETIRREILEFNRECVMRNRFVKDLFARAPRGVIVSSFEEMERVSLPAWYKRTSRKILKKIEGSSETAR